MGAAGILFLAAGAILYWVVEIDVPYANDDALGGILMVAGIVALTMSALMKAQRAQTGVGAGVAMIAVGAIVYWAVDFNLPYVDDDALGAILMVAGAIGVAASVIVNAQHAETGVGAGVGLVAVGAIVYWAVDLNLPYIFDDALATILMVAGAIGVVAAVLMHLRRSRVTRVQGQRY
ncbi:MAG: hypothetical protein GEU93_13715 [Propionibacteriales bacterium]|nr:hypothetical protein [Propionibacteriales bacterium]